MNNNLLCFVLLFTTAVADAADLAATNTHNAIPWNEIGVKAGADYKGDGLAVTPTDPGARLHCVFQRLDGEATPEGLWLTSTVTNTVNDRFRVTAMEVGRKGSESSIILDDVGDVSVDSQTVRFRRAGLTEEYSVSMDGVRQDFVVEQSPSNPPGGELVVKLAVVGAQIDSKMPSGLVLTFADSGRKIAYSRLRVTDATGKELPARIEVHATGEKSIIFASWSDTGNLIEELNLLTTPPAKAEVAVVVNDEAAAYPVRIDPTFSDVNWVSMGGFPGVNGQVNAAVVDNTGKLYIGGEFTLVGNTIANNIAQWNGSSWSSLGSGISGDYYGNPTDIVPPYVEALAVSGSTLYAGGQFTTAGGNAANSIAQWNGSNWSPLGGGMGGSFPYVGALAVSGSMLYAGGSFTTAGDNTNANYIAQWNGSSWSALGSGISGGMYPDVSALAVSGSTLYAGGAFTTAGGSAANCIAKWNGTNWTALGGGISGSHIDGNGPSVSALVVSGGTLYAGGAFTTAGDDTNANNIALWNGSSWAALGSGISGGSEFVSALAVSGTTLYAGGNFTTAGSSLANYIAQWNGSNWLALGSGISGGDEIGTCVLALVVSGSALYAGGDFTTADGAAANNIAQWNGNRWSAAVLGSGLNDFVSALAVSGSTLYAGGDFTTAGSSAANYVAQWNGSGWLPLGSGMNAEVDALAVSGNTLYAGGQFTTAGEDTNANGIAQWNGSNWTSLSSGISGGFYGGRVYALAVSGNTLFAGGTFTMAGSDTGANNIAQWNGSTWSALGSGISGGTYPGVFALAVSGSTLYAGGSFTTAGGDTNANNIAQWNGSSWSGLGSGTGVIADIGSPSVEALAVSGSTLYAGGEFTTAGTNVSAFAAMANLAGTPVSVAIVTNNAAFGFTNGVFGFDVAGPSGSSVVIQASTDLQTWIPLQTNLLGSGPLYFSDPRSPTNRQRFYRAVLP